MKMPLAIASLSFVCIACGSGNSTPDVISDNRSSNALKEDISIPADREVRSSGEPYIGRLTEEVGMPEALMTGMLVVENNCLVFRSGSSSSLAILPKDAKFDRAMTTVVTSTGDIALNQKMQFGGGSYPENHEIFSQLGSSPPSTCPKEGVIIGDIQ